MSSHAERERPTQLFEGAGQGAGGFDEEPPLFQVTNHHEETCGIPLQIDEQTFSNVYRSYFENENGEQAIFLYDYDQERGILSLGDEGGGYPYDVVDVRVPELILNHPEQLWLSACWEASGALKAVCEKRHEERGRKRHEREKLVQLHSLV